MLLVEKKAIVVETRAAKISLIDEDIVRVFIKPDLEFSTSDIDDIRNAVDQLREGRNIYALVDVSENTTGDKEVREYGARHGISEISTATAYITNSLAQKIIVNFFITFYRRGLKYRMFTSEKDAIVWLKSFQHR